jgi:hypothetical protein
LGFVVVDVGSVMVMSVIAVALVYVFDEMEGTRKLMIASQGRISRVQNIRAFSVPRDLSEARQ